MRFKSNYLARVLNYFFHVEVDIVLNLFLNVNKNEPRVPKKSFFKKVIFKVCSKYPARGGPFMGVLWSAS